MRARASLLAAAALSLSSCAGAKAPAPDAVSEPIGGAADCVRSLCGCWEEDRLDYSVTVVDEDGGPLAEVKLFCLSETEPIAITDSAGHASFSIETMNSPGCGYERCNNIEFRPPEGSYKAQQLPAHGTNGGQITLVR